MMQFGVTGDGGGEAHQHASAGPESPCAAANRALLGDIARIHAESSGTYGSPRVHAVAAPGLIHRSDRGIQCAAETYRQALAGSGITPSMSHKADCWDNAPIESFFHTLKIERVHHRVYPTRDQARRDLFQYSKGFHNPPVEHWRPATPISYRPLRPTRSSRRR
jgi:transposase InsO family protein